MEERLGVVTSQLNETTEIVEEATTTINCLHVELRKVQEGAQSSKGESVKRPEALGKMVAVWKKELNEVIHRWPKFFCAHTTAIRLTFPSSESHQQEILEHVILQKLLEDHVAGSAAVNAAFGN